MVWMVPNYGSGEEQMPLATMTHHSYLRRLSSHRAEQQIPRTDSRMECLAMAEALEKIAVVVAQSARRAFWKCSIIQFGERVLDAVSV